MCVYQFMLKIYTLTHFWDSNYSIVVFCAAYGCQWMVRSEAYEQNVSSSSYIMFG